MGGGGSSRRREARSGNFSRRFFTHISIPFAAAADLRFGCEEHVVVPDHEDDGLRLESVDPAVVETPEHVLRFVTADADVLTALRSGKCFAHESPHWIVMLSPTRSTSTGLHWPAPS